MAVTTSSKCCATRTGIEALVGQDGNQLKRLVQEALQEVKGCLCTDGLSAELVGRLGGMATGNGGTDSSRGRQKATPCESAE